ncbi:MAG TPA: SEL1-like repeat protein [Stellaceae bacterium]|nr:SEL1-like repeat protein [Stellaceae bacterium]
MLGAGVLLALAAGAAPARAQFYSLEGRFQCLDHPGAVCFDATSDAPPPPLARRRPAPVETGAAPHAKAERPERLAAIEPSAGQDPLQPVIARLEAREPRPEDIVVLRRLARRGDKRAVELLAWANLKGIGVPPDPTEAYLLYGTAASLGVRHAKQNQAVVYETMMTPDQRQQALDIENEVMLPSPR